MDAEIWKYVIIVVILDVTVHAAADDGINDCPVVATFRERLGEILSSPDFPQPDNTTGCTQWFIESQPNNIIIISFEDLDIPSTSTDGCSSGEVVLGPTPTVNLCGKLRYQDSRKRSYISERSHVWIQYRHIQGQSGRGFKLSYIMSERNSTSCFRDYYKCASGYCILPKWQCNGGDECSDGSDEDGCDQVRWPPPPYAPYTCRANYFGCNDTSHGEYRCFPDSLMCDGIEQCDDGKDEAHCRDEDKCEWLMEGPTGILKSPNFPEHYPNGTDCEWDIHVERGSVIQLRFKQFSIYPDTADYLEIHDKNKDTLLGRFDGSNPPPDLVESFSNRVMVHFVSDSTGTQQGFNATFQRKGVCLPGQVKCGFGEEDCYEDDQSCDGSWDCPQYGGDERGCGHCGSDRFACGTGNQCYSGTDHCNGIAHCSNKMDERGCSTSACGPHNGTFLCRNMRCIYESWTCDGADDCDDNSDENQCPLSRKVVIAAVVGSLVCALLLTIALGCTCQLHALRVREQNRRRYQSPLTQIQEAISASRLAPPNYNDAMQSSRSYDEAQRDFLQRIEEAREQGEVDIPSLVSAVTALPNTADPQESGPATRRIPRTVRQPQQRDPPSVPPAIPEDPESSDDSLIDVEPSSNPALESDVMVNLSLDAGVSAQWRRQRPKDHTRAVMPGQGGQSSGSKDHTRAVMPGQGGQGSGSKDHARAVMTGLGGQSSGSKDHARAVMPGQGGQGSGSKDHTQAVMPGQGGQGSGSKNHARAVMPGQGGQGSGSKDHTWAVMPGQGDQGSGSKDRTQAIMPGQGGQGSGSKDHTQAIMPGQGGQGSGLKDHTRVVMPGQGGQGSLTMDSDSDDQPTTLQSANQGRETISESTNQEWETESHSTNQEGGLGSDLAQNMRFHSSESPILSINAHQMVPKLSKETVLQSTDDGDMVSLASLSSHSRSDEHNSEHLTDDSSFSLSDSVVLDSVPTVGSGTLCNNNDTSSDINEDIKQTDDMVVDISDTQALIC